jgi:cell division inhibitor SulA
VVAALARLDEPQFFLVLEDRECVEVDVCASGIADEVSFGEDVPRVAALLLLEVVLQHLQQVLALLEELIIRHVIGDYQRTAHLGVDKLVSLTVDQPLYARLVLPRHEQAMQIIL